jgi:hypothetical protein
MRRSWFKALVLSLGGLGFCSEEQGTPDPVCKRFILPIAQEVGVPVALLEAIASVESKYQPYALNHQGKSLSFTTPGEAWGYVEKHLKAGHNMDIGCMQVNWRAHQDQLEDARQLLIPTVNIRYAALFLKSLYQELGSWSRAVASYHSRTPHKGHVYLIKVAHRLKEEKALTSHQNWAIRGMTVWHGQPQAASWNNAFFPKPVFLFKPFRVQRERKQWLLFQ